MTLAQDKQAIDVGHEMAKLLVEWRPDISGEDVASAIMHTLEHYSITLEGASESGMRSCLFRLRDKIDQRIKSL